MKINSIAISSDGGLSDYQKDTMEWLKASMKLRGPWVTIDQIIEDNGVKSPRSSIFRALEAVQLRLLASRGSTIRIRRQRTGRKMFWTIAEK